MGEPADVNVVLLSTYDLGHQPFGLASPAAWLKEAGASVTCNDVAVEPLNEAAIKSAALIAIHLPMHTATRLASQIVPKIRGLNPRAHLCFFGLYAPLNESYLRELGAGTVLGGEYEQGLVDLYAALRAIPGGHPAFQSSVSVAKQEFRIPDRQGLPKLEEYAFLERSQGERVAVGYTEASRGCKHLCRHCPVVPVYQGRFRVVSPDVVLADIATQVAAGADHISFGDPDFFNGVSHGRRVIHQLHDKFPELSYDVTIKVEHLLKHADALPELAETGCLFMTTAVEAVDDAILAILDKGHSRADFIEAVRRAGEVGLTLSPTFVPFTPWTTLAGYLDLLTVIADLDLIEQVSPVQLAIRLLLPRGSLLLERPETQAHLLSFDPEVLSYRWANPDPRVDALQQELQAVVERGDSDGKSRHAIFDDIRRAACRACDVAPAPLRPASDRWVPRMSEPWYCCAEPTTDQFERV